MRRLGFLSVFLLSFCLTAWSQEGYVDLTFETQEEKQLWETGVASSNPYYLFLAVHGEEGTPIASWEKLVSTTTKKFNKSGVSMKLLRSIFEKSHKYLFKTYEQHATFSQMLETGKYDCVSGSATLAMLLEQYGFDFEIIETDYHVFIITKLDGKEIILESTLPIGGLITSPTEVQKYLSNYQGNQQNVNLSLNQRLGTPAIDYSDNSIFRKVDLQQLAGLQYYNDAIAHFNQQSYDVAVTQLQKAYELYPANRISGLKELAIEQLNQPLQTRKAKK
ncbi:hypothetical protein SAMN04488104_10487 [Algoriphagus faecimaris]|uniref:Tetratricopeptide repeat-containing protein n=1 Tax=Algoriphagus faecimaris TaxID=686796 RepID=A0A1G6WUZ3_9BACT|nr:hypothetical protein SAMN04488104_10487 [Algoriphagus faecimaris]